MSCVTSRSGSTVPCEKNSKDVVPGDIVCAKNGMFPFWPCLVYFNESAYTDSNLFLRYFNRSNAISRFNETWTIRVESERECYDYLSKEFSKCNYDKEKTLFDKYEKALRKAWEEVKKIVKWSHEKRLKRYNVNNKQTESTLKVKRCLNTKDETNVIKKKKLKKDSFLQNLSDTTSDTVSTSDSTIPCLVNEKVAVPGDIICGKTANYPFWPCLVHTNQTSYTDSDLYLRYFNRSNISSRLNETWIIKVECENEYSDYVSKYISKYNYDMEKSLFDKYENTIKKAWKEAEEFLKLTREQRLDSCNGINDPIIIEKLQAKRSIVLTDVSPVIKKKEKKCLKYAFTSLDFPGEDSDYGYSSCRYCLISNTKTVKCKCGCFFHETCVNKLRTDLNIENNIDKDNLCMECLLKIEICLACSYEIVEADNILKCSIKQCGKVYHKNCMEKRSIADFVRTTFEKKLVCPRHLCHHCVLEDNTHEFKCKRMIYCIMCVGTYHTGDWCVPAGAVQLSKTDIICPKHLPCGKHVRSFIPPYTARVHSDVQFEIYGNISDISNTIIMPKKTKSDVVNVNFCFKCGKEKTCINCVSCPAAYHLTCSGVENIPPKYYCISCKLGNYHTNGEILWIKYRTYNWWPGQIIHVDNVPDNILRMPHNPGQFVIQFFGTFQYGWTDNGRVFTYEEGDKKTFQDMSKIKFAKKFSLALEEAENGYKNREFAWENNSAEKLQKSKSFKSIQVNKYYGSVRRPKPLKLAEYPTCNCTGKDSTEKCQMGGCCRNIAESVECHPSLCKMKEECQNQNFFKRKYPKQEVFWSNRCGWGVKTNENIKKFQFVIEYVGEIINSKEVEERREWAKDNNINDFYFMNLDRDRIIDARQWSNISRFINHSCDPNMRAEKWTVHGNTRIGLFALRNIKDGEELFLNYVFENITRTCYCGSENCSGDLGIRPAKISKKNRSKHLEKPCFRCFKYCGKSKYKICSLKFCERIYHIACLDIPTSFIEDNIRWICPLHLCDKCGQMATNFCTLCTVSSCLSHLSIFFVGEATICIYHNED